MEFFANIFEYFEHGHFKKIQIEWTIVLVGNLNFLKYHNDQHLDYTKKPKNIGINPKEITNKWILKNNEIERMNGWMGKMMKINEDDKWSKEWNEGMNIENLEWLNRWMKEWKEGSKEEMNGPKEWDFENKK